MTKKLYETDSYIKEFEAKVLSCEFNNGFYEVVLSETAFFPEGGGQSADTGFLDDVEVTDVKEENEKIIHIVKKELEINKTVKGVINWEERYSRMQSHAGEHIVAGTVHKLFGYSNVGFHLGKDFMTVDFDGPLSKEDIEAIEIKANEAIYKNAPIFVSFPSKKELESIEYRSKIDFKEGVRLITIEGIDCCACCAPHPNFTGEIGAIKILSFASYKKGTRIEMIAGINAVKDYILLNDTNKNLMKLLSAKRDGIYDAVIKNLELLKELKSEKESLKKELALLKLKKETLKNGCFAFIEGAGFDSLRYVANEVLKEEDTVVLFSEEEPDEYLYVFASKKEDIRENVKKLNSLLNGKGGGKSDYAQGKISAEKEDIIKILNEIMN